MDPKAIKALKGYVQELERLAEEQKAIGEQRSGIFETAKAAGFSLKAIREVVKLRQQDQEERDAHDTVIDLYRKAMGIETQGSLF